MTYAPETLLAARTLLIKNVPGLIGAEVGIVGDGPHAATGNSYHLGSNQLSSGSYSIVESPRDRSGLTDAAAALDIGEFQFERGGKTHNLRTFNVWLVGECKAGAADTKDIREVIYSTDGSTVKRWDRLGRRTTGDSSHRWHTHISYFRDSEKRDKTGLFLRYLAETGLSGESEEGGTDMLVKQGDTGQEVKFWQYVLASLGYPVGDIDGVYGPKMNTAVNAYRNKFAAAGSGSATMITGWQGWHMLAQMMSKYAGLPGAPGKDGAAGRDGKDGRDGVFTGTLNITGGTLSAVAPTQGS